MDLSGIQKAIQSTAIPEISVIWKDVSGQTKKITEVSLKVFLGIALFFVNNTLFTVGFTLGFIFPEKTAEVIEKVKKVWKDQTSQATITVCVAAFLSLPATVAMAATLYGAHLGCDWSYLGQQNNEALKAG